jgi:protoheme IX farnesyltransferase
MLPVVASSRRVNTEILLFTWLTVAASLAAWPLGLSAVYGFPALVVGALFLVEAHRLVGRSRRGEPLRPMRLFHWSITYLTVLFVAVAVDALL